MGKKREKNDIKVTSDKRKPGKSAIGKNTIYAVASRPTAGRLVRGLADRQSVVQADGQPGPAQLSNYRPISNLSLISKMVIVEFRCLNSVHNFSGLILHTFIGNTNNYSFQEKITH